MKRSAILLLVSGIVIVSGSKSSAAEEADQARRVYEIRALLRGRVVVDEKAPGRPVTEVDLAFCHETTDDDLRIKYWALLQTTNVTGMR